MSLEKVITEKIFIEEDEQQIPSTKRTVLVPKLVKERENWPKFGVAITKQIQDSTETISTKPEFGNEMFVRLIDSGDVARVEKTAEEIELEQLKRQKEVALQNLNAPLETTQKPSSGIYVPRREASSYSMEEVNTTIKVSNLGPDVDEYILEEIFRRFGHITRCFLARTSYLNEEGERVRGESRGFGFITFMTENQALNAVEGMHGKILDHTIIDVEMSKPKGK